MVGVPALHTLQGLTHPTESKQVKYTLKHLDNLILFYRLRVTPLRMRTIAVLLIRESFGRAEQPTLYVIARRVSIALNRA